MAAPPSLFLLYNTTLQDGEIICVQRLSPSIHSIHTHVLSILQTLRQQKEDVDDQITKLAAAAAKDLGLIMDKTIKLEWHKVANTRTRCLRITQKEEKTVRSKLSAR